MSNIIGMNFADQVHSKASEGKIRKNTLLSALSVASDCYYVCGRFHYCYCSKDTC